MRDSDPRDRGSTPFSAACDPRLPNWQGGRPLTVRSRFESWSGSLLCGVAQRQAHRPHKPLAEGSSPSPATMPKWRNGRRTAPRTRRGDPCRFKSCFRHWLGDNYKHEGVFEFFLFIVEKESSLAHSSSGQEAGPSTLRQRFDSAMRHLVCTCSSIGKSSCPTNRRLLDRGQPGVPWTMSR